MIEKFILLIKYNSNFTRAFTFTKKNALNFINSQNIQIPWSIIDADIDKRIEKFIENYFASKKTKQKNLAKNLIFDKVFIYFSNSEISVFIYILETLKKKNKQKFILYLADSYWEKKVVKYLYPEFFVFHIIHFNFSLLSKTFSNIFSKLIHYKFSKNSSVYKNQEISNSLKVMIYPHKTLNYGNLFSKDYIIPDLNDTEFYFFEWNREKELGEYYKSKNYNVVYFREKIWNSKFLIFSILLQKELVPFVFNFFKINFQVSICILEHNIIKELIKIEIKRINPSICIIGYDILFPQTVKDALEDLNIRTVAITERSQAPFYNSYKVHSDIYFVPGIKYIDIIRKNYWYVIKEIREIGLIRTDFIFTLKKTKTRKEKQILVLDLGSELADTLYLNNWDNNILFYTAIIKLAKNFPEYTYVIRGKNSNWTKIAVFSQIFDEINRIDNIKINTSSEPLESYSLLAESNAVVCRQTSMADEAISAGYKVIFYDEYVNNSTHLKPIFDYSNMALIAQSYSELENYFNRFIVMEEEFRDFEVIKNYYGIFDGLVKQRFDSNIIKIINERAN